ncbi:MAG: LPS-assembly protein LptD [Bacteroidales bacterium]|nr:LPS-assembly protein LptD [Bacteroidales bacterium]
MLLLALCAPDVAAQLRRNRRAAPGQFGGNIAHTVAAPPDSVTLALRDSMMRADSLRQVDSVALLSKSSLEAPAFSAAKDSIVEVFHDGQRRIFYYGDVTVTYQDMKLTAAYMEYDMNSSTVYARGVLDTLTGEWTGQPEMVQAGKTYNMEELYYNFDTRKARIKNMITNEDDAILHGQNIKMMPDQSVNMTQGKYTVCDAPDPHYYLSLSSARIVTEPSQKTVFGPAQLVVEGVGLPLILPFGFIPERPKRATGLLLPTFGEEAARGFYARDMGMYFVLGDHVDISLTGDYYTLGSWAVNLNSRYKFNYKFSGNLSFAYSKDQTGEKGTPDFYQSTNFAFRWSHSQDAKAHPGSSFSASVNFSSPSNSRYNSHNVQEALQNQISSSISYGHNWNGKFNLSVNALHSQNSRDSSYTFTLPNVSMSMSTIYPFKRKNRVGKERFYEQISFGYSASLSNKISFKASEFMKEGFFDRFQNGMTHNFSIGLPSLTLFNYINITPGVSYGMNWFFRAKDYAYNPETDKVEAQDSGQFGAFGVTQTYSGSVSANTRIYGTFNFGSDKAIQAIRHIITPSVSMSFAPDLGTYANGYRTIYYTDQSGTEREYQYNRYSGQMGSVPGRGKSASASFSIGNNIEAKVRDRTDTTGVGNKKIKLIDQLNINGSYNFLADSMRLSTISMSMSTNLFSKVNISASANFDPYAIDGDGRRINKFNVAQKGFLHLARLTNASASMSFSLNGKGAGVGNAGGSTADSYKRVYTHPITGEYIPGGWLYYTNPSAPWSMNFSYSLSYSKSYAKDEEGVLQTRHNIMQTLGVTGNFRITPRLSINANTGFDLKAMQLTTTQISATYDLHCFNISVSWVPTGTWKSYSFCIAANAAQLADLLKFRKSSSYWDN